LKGGALAGASSPAFRSAKYALALLAEDNAITVADKGERPATDLNPRIWTKIIGFLNVFAMFLRYFFS
jgi:hypothetical protein